jgi:hypothetical protein
MPTRAVTGENGKGARRDERGREQAEAAEKTQSNFVDPIAEGRCRPTAARNEDSQSAICLLFVRHSGYVHA